MSKKIEFNIDDKNYNRLSNGDFSTDENSLIDLMDKYNILIEEETYDITNKIKLQDERVFNIKIQF